MRNVTQYTNASKMNKQDLPKLVTKIMANPFTSSTGLNSQATSYTKGAGGRRGGGTKSIGSSSKGAMPSLH